MTDKSPIPGLAFAIATIALIAVLAEKMKHADRVKQQEQERVR
jgi:hypothetical protein